MISVIIPVYNVAPYLREALDSILHQTYQDLEIIIVDDGSTDASGSICDQFLSDSRFQVIHQENKGLSGARNTGLDQATGEYISFFDPDDAFMPEMLQKMALEIERTDADIVECGFIVYQTEGRLDDRRNNSVSAYHSSKKDKLLTSEETQKRVITGDFSVTVWNKLYKKEIWNEIRFPEGHVYEDMSVIFSVLEKCKRILILPDYYVLHRKRNDSITGVKSIRNTEDSILAHRQMEEYVAEHTPEVFSNAEYITFLEGKARATSIQYAQYSHQHRELMSIYEKEAKIRWQSLKGQSLQLKTRAVRFLFFHSPGLLIPFHKIWYSCKRLVRG